MTKEKEEEVKEPERHEYTNAQDIQDPSILKERERERKNRLIHHLAIDGGVGYQGVEIEMKTGRYPKPCRVFAMVVNEGY